MLKSKLSRRFSWFVFLLMISLFLSIIKVSSFGKSKVDNSVLQAQKILQEKGYYKGSIDGIWGEKISHAILSFQKIEGLVETGFLDLPTKVEMGLPVVPLDEEQIEIYERTAFTRMFEICVINVFPPNTVRLVLNNELLTYAFCLCAWLPYEYQNTYGYHDLRIKGLARPIHYRFNISKQYKDNYKKYSENPEKFCQEIFIEIFSRVISRYMKEEMESRKSREEFIKPLEEFIKMMTLFDTIYCDHVFATKLADVKKSFYVSGQDELVNRFKKGYSCKVKKIIRIETRPKYLLLKQRKLLADEFHGLSGIQDVEAAFRTRTNDALPYGGSDLSSLLKRNEGSISSEILAFLLFSTDGEFASDYLYSAARLAGKSYNPILVPSLIYALLHGDNDISGVAFESLKSYGKKTIDDIRKTLKDKKENNMKLKWSLLERLFMELQ